MSTTTPVRVPIVVISVALAEHICKAAIPLQFDNPSHRLARSEKIKTTMRFLVGQSIPETEIPELVRQIRTRHFKSLVDPGAAVGAYAAATLSQDIAQKGFNTFHLAGANNAVGGVIGDYDKLLGASKTVDPTKTFIFFKDPGMDRLDIVLANRRYAQLYFKNIITDGSVQSVSELTPAQLAWYNLFWSTHGIGEWENLANYFFPAAPTMARVLPLRDRLFLRLRINTNVLYFNRLKIKDLVETIFREPTKLSSKSKKVDVSAVRIIWSPDVHGEIHIFIRNETDIQDIKHQDIDDGIIKISMFLNMVRTDISTLLVKGIPGIKFLYPQSQHVWLTISSIDKMEAENYYCLRADNFSMMRYNITLERVVNFCRYVGLRPRGVMLDDNAIVVEAPSGRTPDEVVADFDKIESKSTQEYNDRVMAGEIPLSIQPGSEYSRIANRYYAVAEGGNIRQLFYQPEIDHNALISNSVSEMYKHWGIGVTQNYITLYLRMLGLDSGSQADPRHDMLFANNMCNLGIPLSYGYTGGRSSERSAMVRAVFERPMEELAHAGLGDVNSTTEAVTAIVIGVEPRIGTASESFATVFPEAAKKESQRNLRALLRKKRAAGASLPANTLSQQMVTLEQVAKKTAEREDKPFLRSEAMARATLPIKPIEMVLPAAVVEPAREKIEVESLAPTVVSAPDVPRITGPLPLTGLDILPNLTMPAELLTRLSAIPVISKPVTSKTRTITLPTGRQIQLATEELFSPAHTLVPATGLEPQIILLPELATPAGRPSVSIADIFS